VIRINLNGVDVKISKFKVTIYDPEDKMTDDEAKKIATYLFNEGFIKKTEFPVAIVKDNE